MSTRVLFGISCPSFRASETAVAAADFAAPSRQGSVGTASLSSRRWSMVQI